MKLKIISLLTAWSFAVSTGCVSSSAMEPPMVLKNFPMTVASQPATTPVLSDLDSTQIDVLRHMTKNGISPSVDSVSVSSEFNAAYDLAFRRLPEPLQRLFLKYVRAVAVAWNLGPSAANLDVAYRSSLNQKMGIIVLDQEVLSKPVNQWLIEKELTAYRPQEGVEIKVKAAEPAENTLISTIQYVLLHELGHLIERNSEEGPCFCFNHMICKSPFYRISWSFEDDSGFFKGKFDASYPREPKLEFYTAERPRLSGKDTLAIYRWLNKTSFPNLYASVHPQEDFAESFSTFLMGDFFNRPLDYTVTFNEETVTVHSCWKSERCAEKRAAIRDILDRELSKL